MLPFCAFATSITGIKEDGDTKVFNLDEVTNIKVEDCPLLASIEIPEAVTYIRDGAFSYCTSITSIDIAESVTEIGDRAFSYCTSLTSIEIPESVTYIGNGAFSYCTSLTSIVVDKDNKVYDSRENCNAIIETASNTLLLGCQNTVIPNSVTTIGEWAFWGCTSLTSIEIPNSVTTIGMGAFSDCSKLKTARVPVSLKGKIDSYTFPSTCEIEWYGGAETTAVPAEETGLRFIYNKSTMTATVRDPENRDAKEVKIPSQVYYDGKVYDVTIIRSSAFKNSESLTSIVLGNSVTEIRYGAFRSCESLTSIVVDKDNKVYDSRENCNAIIETASNTLVAGCQNTVIPNSVTEIGNYAFWNCTSLTSIDIPESVTEIGERAFAYCENLTSIEIPNSVTTIGRDAFAGCKSLTSIEIPNSVTEIGNYAFWNCSKLKTARVPKNCKYNIYYSFPNECTIIKY
ncbi:MAG: leucine-rich repeat domain-containing protein [Paludibacteraceae bacterium]|nr:leucine-rich repeat domain-containing protein [Paludibacteraceae bacterium]